MTAKKITAAELRSKVRYDPKRGTFTWIERPSSPSFNARWAGKPAGAYSDRGYLMLRIGDYAISGLNAAWLIHTGRQPRCMLYFRNGDRADYRWSNIGEVGERR